MRIIYDARNYDAPLPQFIDGLSVYLDSILPKRNASNIGHYKSLNRPQILKVNSERDLI
jgi:hypothetical protein